MGDLSLHPCKGNTDQPEGKSKAKGRRRAGQGTGSRARCLYPHQPPASAEPRGGLGHGLAHEEDELCSSRLRWQEQQRPSNTRHPFASQKETHCCFSSGFCLANLFWLHIKGLARVCTHGAASFLRPSDLCSRERTTDVIQELKGASGGCPMRHVIERNPDAQALKHRSRRAARGRGKKPAKSKRDQTKKVFQQSGGFKHAWLQNKKSRQLLSDNN